MFLRRSPRLAAKGTGAPQSKPADKAIFKPANKINNKNDDHCANRHAMHVKIIRDLLESAEIAEGKENKVICACTLFRYINDNAMDFVKRHDRFGTIVVVKAIELIVEGRDYPNLMLQVVKFLHAMGVDTLQIKRFMTYKTDE